MSSEERVKAEPCAGAFNGCLVDGDPAENARERKIKRRAIGISVLLQSAGLAMLLIAPLFATTEELTERVVLPIPPYRSVPVQPQSSAPPPTGRTQPQRFESFLLAQVPPMIARYVDAEPPTDVANGIVGLPPGAGTTGPIDMSDSRRQPPPPVEPVRPKTRISEPRIDPALLTRRIEPTYPPLARQLHKSGRVELHAIIGTDGSVQSLQVVSGDPLFINSAKDAVLRWRYRPTYLNGQPVEVDTYISVIYTLQE